MFISIKGRGQNCQVVVIDLLKKHMYNFITFPFQADYFSINMIKYITKPRGTQTYWKS